MSHTNKVAVADKRDLDYEDLSKLLDDMTARKAGFVSSHVLRTLINRTEDQGFREELAWAGVVPRLLAVVHKFFSPGDARYEGRVDDPDERGLCVMLLITKLLRNLCAGVTANQNAFRVWDGVATMVQVAGWLLAATKNGSLADSAAGFFPLILQVLGNFANSGEEYQAVVWETWFPGLLLEFSQLEDAKVYDPLCMLLFTCCRGSPQRTSELCGSGSPLLAALLRFAEMHLGYGGLTNPSSSVLETADEGGRVQPAYVEAWKRNVHVWLELLLSHICLQQPFLASAFIGLGSSRLAVTDPEKASRKGSGSADQLFVDSNIGKRALEEVAFSRTQVILLGTLCSIMHDHAEEAGNNDLVNYAGKSSLIANFPSSSANFLVSLIRVAAQGKHFEVDDSTLASDILRFGLSFVRMLCGSELETHGEGAFREEERSAMVMQLLSAGLPGLMLEMLDALGPPEAIKAPSGSAVCLDSDREPRVHRDRPSGFVPMNPYTGYRRDIVGVLSNMSYQNRHVQDEIRKWGGLLLVLQQCVVDKDNPFLREWGYWAMRNILAGNEDNQKIIEELEVKGAVNTEEVQNMGLSVEIDSISRRPKLVNRPAGNPNDTTG